MHVLEAHAHTHQTTRTRNVRVATAAELPVKTILPSVFPCVVAREEKENMTGTVAAEEKQLLPYKRRTE